MGVQVPIEFVSDTSELEPVLTVFNKLGLIADDELSKFKAANAEFAKRSAIIAQTTGPMDKLASSAKNVNANLANGATNKLVEDLRKQIEQLSKQVDDLKKKNESNGTASSNVFKQMKKEYNELVAAAQEAYAANNRALGDELFEKAGKLQDKISDLRATTKAYASDTATLDSLAQGVTAIGAGFEVAQGAQVLFGKGHEDLQKTLVKVQATMALVNGLTTIQTALQKESALRIGLTNAGRVIENLLTKAGVFIKTEEVVVKEADNVAGTAQEIITKKVYTAKIIENALTSESVIVRGLATAAQWALNAAMDANPIGLLILAIAAVVGAFALFSSSADAAAEEQKKLNEMESQYLDALKAVGDFFKDRGDQRAKQMQDEIDQMTAAGKSQDDIKAKEIELAKLRVANADQQVRIYKDEIDNLDVNKKSVAELTIQYEKLNMQKTASDSDAYDKQIDAIKAELDATKTKVQLGQDANDAQIQANNDLTNSTLENDRTLAQEGLKSRKASIEAKLKFAKEGSEQQYALDKALAQAEYDLEIANVDLTAGEREKLYAEMQRKLLEIDAEYQKKKLEDQLSGINAQLAATMKGSKDEFDLKVKALATQRDADLTNIDLTENGKLEIIKQAQRKIDDLTKQFLQQQQVDELKAFGLLNDAKLVMAEKGSADELELKKQALLIKEQIEISSIDKDVAATELGQAQIADIKAKYTAEGIQLDKDAAEAKLKIAEQSFTEQSDYLSKLAKIEASSINTSFERRQQLELQQYDINQAKLEQQKTTEAQRYTDGIITYEEYQRRLTEITDEETTNRLEKEALALQQKYDLEVHYAEQAQQIYTGFLTQAADAAKVISERRVSELENELAHYQEMKDGQEITDKEFEARKKEIEAKIKAEKNAAAKKEKEFAVVQILLDTGVAAVKALATPPAPNFVMAGLTSAFGLAQAAIAAAKPLPQFAKGTEQAPPGWAWVGEQGPELIWLKGGEKIKPAPESKRMAESWQMRDTPFGSASMAMLESAPRLSSSAMEKMLVLSSTGVSIDVERMAQLVGEQVRAGLNSMPLSVFQFDRHGFTASVKEGSQQTNFYNDRYSSK